MEVKVKKLRENAVIPSYARLGDAGLDLTATSKSEDGCIVTYGTGLAFEIPEGYVGLVFPRSSVYKTSMMMTNCVGVVDSGYRGEVMVKFTAGVHEYEVGDRVAQLIIMPYPKIELVEADELSETERGAGGYGHTGR